MQNAARCCTFTTIFALLFINVLAQQQMGSFMAYGPEIKYFSSINYKVYQSRNGYLWFGTGSGLVRFDGKRYKNFFADYADPNSPSDNVIFDIAEDKNGDLWFAGFYHGATRYNQHTGKFTKYPALSKDKNPYYGINSIVSDQDGDLWFGTSGRGLARYNFEKDSFELFFPEPLECRDGSIRGFNHISDIKQDRFDKNILWLGAFHGLYSFNKRNKSFTFYPAPNLKEMLFTTVEQDKHGLLWLGTWGDGLKCFDAGKKIFIETGIGKKLSIVYDIVAINDSIMYAACLNSGLYQLNINSGAFDDITPPGNQVNPVSALRDIQRVSLTPDAGIFIGGSHYVYQQHPDYTRLKKNGAYPDAKNFSENAVLNNAVWDPSRGLYWLATSYSTGIYTLSADLKNFSIINTETTEGDGSHYYYSLAIDARNRVWVMNYKDGILLLDESQKRFIKPKDLSPITDSVINKISKITSTNEGNLWMLADTDFIYWDVHTNKIETYPIRWDDHYTGFRNINSNELKTDPAGNAWLFTQNGMFNCKRSEKKVVHIYKTGTTINDLASTIVITGAFNKNNDLWISSGNGIQVINWKDYSLLSTHDPLGGLPSMLVRGLATDSTGRVWAALASGLGLFDTKTKAWQLFNRLDGLEKDYLDTRLIITSNNKLFVPQQDGFLVKDIDELMPISKPPLLHITGIRINNESYADSLLPEFVNKLELPYDRNNIDIEFAGMDWVYPFKTTYRYRIDGLSSVVSWNNSEAKINLTAIPAGSYVLHIQALSGNGIWSKEIVFPIIIHPPFWRTWWFISLCILAVIAVLYGLYRYRINEIIKMQRVRNSISRDLHDEIGATLSSVNMLSAVALIRSAEKDDAAPIIAQIKNAVQRAGESIDDIVWSVNPANDLAQDTFARIRKYATELAEAKGLNCIIDIDEPGSTLKLPMELRRDIYLVCKEAVNNALKYSGCSSIGLSIRLKNQQLLLTISDNGNGFEPSILQGSLRNGISNMRHRIQKHGGSFEITSSPGKGTIIQCKVRLKV